MITEATITSIFRGNGGGVASRIWISTQSSSYNFDIHNLVEAQKFRVGQVITVRIENGRAFPVW